jgi:hypothetical protein
VKKGKKKKKKGYFGPFILFHQKKKLHCQTVKKKNSFIGSTHK